MPKTGKDLFDHMKKIADTYESSFVTAIWDNKGPSFGHPWPNIEVQIEYNIDSYGIRYPEKLLPDTASKITLPANRAIWKIISASDAVIVLDDALAKFGLPTAFREE
jgi:hypothetical protein